MQRTYTDEELHKAVSSVKKRMLSISRAAREFGIPRTTIHDHVHKPELRTTKGPSKQLTKDESDGLVEFALYMARQGFPLTRRMIRCYVQEIVKRAGRSTLFNLEKGPSDEWFRKLQDDYPELSFRKPESRDIARSRMSNFNVANQFFQFWSDLLEEYGLHDKPSQVYNCDETGWSGKESARSKVLGPKTGHIFKQKPLTANHITAHLCVSADGRFIPTMIIFKGGLPHRHYKDGLPGTWLFSSSDTGYMDTELFLEWFEKCFIPNCGKSRPVVLLMDNHDSHISLPLVEAARKEDVLLVGLPSHTTHYLQPLDVHVIGPLKNKVSTIASDVGFTKPGCTIGKSRLPVVLHHAIDRTPPSSVKEAFRLAGVFPVNPDVIETSQLVPPTFQGPCSSSDTGPTRTCETCGQFIHQNPLVERGLVPASLVDVLVPPPMKPVSEKKRKSKVVSTGRVISGDEMLQILKDRENADLQRQEEKKKREEERVLRRKKKEEEEEIRVVKRQKREQKRNERGQEKLREKERAEKYGRLAEKKYTCGVCGVRGRVNDEVQGIEWYGCDNEECVKTGWFHFECLSEREKDVLRDSLDNENISWYCKGCFPRFYDEE